MPDSNGPSGGGGMKHFADRFEIRAGVDRKGQWCGQGKKAYE